MKKNDLIFEDEMKISNTKREMMLAGEKLNRFKEEAQEILGDLSNEQKHELCKRGPKFVEDEVRKQFPYPKADDEFNLRALGVNLTEIKKEKVSSWSRFNFEIDENGDFIPADKQPAIETHRYYLDTDLKIQALSFGESLAKIINEGIEEGFVDKSNLKQLEALTKSILKVNNLGKNRADVFSQVDNETIGKLEKKQLTRASNRHL